MFKEQQEARGAGAKGERSQGPPGRGTPCFAIPEGVSFTLDFKKRFVKKHKKDVMGEMCSGNCFSKNRSS